jgi:hypothetical protein
MAGVVGAVWGLAGVALLLGSAIYRLSFLAIESFSYQFLWYHWITLVFVVLCMAYSEGYRAFQKGFSPRVAARARYLRDHPRFLYVLGAPLFCMAYFHAPRKRKITSLSVTVGIVVLVLLVHLLQQPWRGIIDLGVVVGLAWGLISLFVFSILAFTSRVFPYSPEVPEMNE